MIYISRVQDDEVGNPIQPNDTWFALAETKTATAIEEEQNHSPEDSIYGHVEVRKALEKLFHSKCAYCEQPLEESGWNVEHYRPKKAVAEAGEHNGYYWLCYQWENLYPSCVPCNQRRKDKPLWDDPQSLAAAGKSDQFPLVDERKRAYKPADDIDLEEPLLIDPCKDTFDGEFTFDPVGQVIVYNKSLRLKATVEICHLQRRRLRIMREKVIQQVIEFIRTIRMARVAGNAEVEAKLITMLDTNFLADKNNHAAVARDVYRNPARFNL